MKRIALIAFILGILMATVAYVAEMNEWTASPEFMTIGFAGYVLIISAAAYYMTAILYEWSRETEVWQG